MDDDDEGVQEVKAQPVKEVKKEVREWKLNETPQMETRQWNTDENKFPKMRHKRAFSRGYAFRDETRPSPKQIRGYGFKDSPPEPETLKPTTPIPLELEYPKLSYCEGARTPPYPNISPPSTTPPYPPDVEPTQTLAEKIKHAMEQHVNSRMPQQKTIEMYTVIPMKTNLASDLQLPAIQ